MIPIFKIDFFKYSRFLFFTLCIIGSISCSSRNDKTITFLHFFNSSDEQKAVENIIKDFESNNKCNVDVIYYELSKGPNELISIMEVKQKFDVIAFDSEWLAQIQDKRLLYDFPNEKNFDSSFYELLIEYCKINGKFNCLPWLVNTRLLYINRKITKENKIENPPKDIQMLLNYSETINERGKYFGIGLVGSGKQTMLKNMMTMILSFGGNLIDSTGELVLDKNINSTGIYNYLKLSHYGLLETKREIENQFIEGHIAYCFSDLSLLQKLIEKNVLQDFIIELIPQNGKKPGISYSEAVMLGVSSNSTNKELSLKFIREIAKWNSEDSFTNDLMKFGVPAQNYYSFNFAGKDINSVIKKQINNSKLVPKHSRWYSISIIIENEIEKAIYSEKSVEGSLADAQEEITNFLKRIRK